MSECIHCNVNLTRNKKTVHTKDWTDNGIVMIRQLLGPNGECFNFDDFTNQFPHIMVIFFNDGIIAAIKKIPKESQYRTFR